MVEHHHQVVRVPIAVAALAGSLLAMIFVVTWAPWKARELFFLVPQIVSIGALIVTVAAADPRHVKRRKSDGDS